MRQAEQRGTKTAEFPGCSTTWNCEGAYLPGIENVEKLSWYT